MLTPYEGSAAAAAAGRNTAAHPTGQSPVPYLFGGLAAMLGLIACALLILICSYWNLSRPVGLAGGEAETDVEDGAVDGGGKAAAAAVIEEKFLVILAGQEKPTCLANPTSSRTSSFGSNTSCGSGTMCSESSTLS